MCGIRYQRSAKSHILDVNGNAVLFQESQNIWEDTLLEKEHPWA